MEQTRKFLKKVGLPSGDDYDLPTSNQTFPDGALYRFEVPGIQGPTGRARPEAPRRSGQADGRVRRAAPGRSAG